MVSSNTGPTDSLAAFVAQLRSQLRDAPASQTTFTFQSSARPREGLTTVSRMRGFELVVDEPPDLGGRDQGPNPVELVRAVNVHCPVHDVIRNPVPLSGGA